MTAINSSANSSVSANLGKSEQLHVKRIREEAPGLEPKKAARDNTISPDATDAVQVAISGQNGGELHTKSLEVTEKKK